MFVLPGEEKAGRFFEATILVIKIFKKSKLINGDINIESPKARINISVDGDWLILQVTIFRLRRFRFIHFTIPNRLSEPGKFGKKHQYRCWESLAKHQSR